MPIDINSTIFCKQTLPNATFFLKYTQNVPKLVCKQRVCFQLCFVIPNFSYKLAASLYMAVSFVHSHKRTIAAAFAVQQSIYRVPLKI